MAMVLPSLNPITVRPKYTMTTTTIARKTKTIVNNVNLTDA